MPGQFKIMRRVKQGTGSMASDNSGFSNNDKKKKFSDNFTSSHMYDQSQLIDNGTDAEVLS